VDLRADLHGQFARRAEDQHLRAAVSRVSELDGRQAKGERFARAGLALAHDVTPGEGDWDGLGLDGGGLLKALGLNGLEEFRREAEVSECLFHNVSFAIKPADRAPNRWATSRRKSVLRMAGRGHRPNRAGYKTNIGPEGGRAGKTGAESSTHRRKGKHGCRIRPNEVSSACACPTGKPCHNTCSGSRKS
jgi:hypothetical protein